MIPLAFVPMPTKLAAIEALFVVMAFVLLSMLAELFETMPMVVAKVFSFVDTLVSRDVTLSAKALSEPPSSIALTLCKRELINSC